MVVHHYTLGVLGTTCGLMENYNATTELPEVSCPKCRDILTDKTHFWSNVRQKTLCGLNEAVACRNVLRVTCQACLNALNLPSNAVKKSVTVVIE